MADTDRLYYVLKIGEVRVSAIIDDVNVPHLTALKKAVFNDNSNALEGIDPAHLEVYALKSKKERSDFPSDLFVTDKRLVDDEKQWPPPSARGERWPTHRNRVTAVPPYRNRVTRVPPMQPTILTGYFTGFLLRRATRSTS